MSASPVACPLDRRAAAVERLRATLTAAERESADRFYVPNDAARWTVARATLRAILGERLGVEPRDLRFSYGERGKPELAAPFARSGLRFNLSHLAGLALCVLTGERRIGVDIERVRPLADLEQLADRNFSPRERAAIRRLAPELAPSPGCTAPVIVEGHADRIVCQTWPEDVR